METSGKKVTLQFTEEMKGFVTFGNTKYDDGYQQGKENDSDLMFHLTIQADDLHGFLA